MRRRTKYTFISCKGHKRRFLKRLHFDYVTVLECGSCFARSHSLLFLYQTEAYTMHHGVVETIWQFSMRYLVLCTSYCFLLLVPAFKVHRPFPKLWVLIKFLITWAAVTSKGFKGATMLLVVSFISFFLLCHRTG